MSQIRNRCKKRFKLARFGIASGGSFSMATARQRPNDDYFFLTAARRRAAPIFTSAQTAPE